jgi:hypothetical protein
MVQIVKRQQQKIRSGMTKGTTGAAKTGSEYDQELLKQTTTK